jgi:hypothetical protein
MIMGTTDIGVLIRFVLALAGVILFLGGPGEIIIRATGADRPAWHSSGFTV